MKKIFLLALLLFSNIYAVSITARLKSSPEFIVDTVTLLSTSKYTHGAIGSMVTTILADLIAKEIFVEEDEDFPPTFYEQIIIYSICGAIAAALPEKYINKIPLGHAGILITAIISAIIVGIPRTLLSSVRKKRDVFGRKRYKTKDHIKNIIKQAVLNNAAFFTAYFGSKGLNKLNYC